MKNVFALMLALSVALVWGCAKQPTVDEVVNKMTEAMGGAENLSKVTDRVETWEFVMFQMPPEMGAMEMPEGGMKMPMVITCKRPNKLRFDFKNPEGSVFMASAFDGTKAWSMQMGQMMELSDAERKEWEVMAATWIDGLYHYQDKGLTLELLPNETINEHEYIVLQATDQYGEKKKYYVNAQTYFMERTKGEMLDMSKRPQMMTMTTLDWKPVDSIVMAHRVALYDSTDQMIWEATLQDVQINTGVEDSYFAAEMMTAK